MNHGCRHRKGNQTHIQGKLPFHFGIQVEKAVDGLNHQPQQNHAYNTQHQAIPYALTTQLAHFLGFARTMLLGNHRIERGHHAEEGQINRNKRTTAQGYRSQIGFARAAGHHRIHKAQPYLRNLCQ